MKKILNFIKALFNGSIINEAVDANILDLSGQGRNKYGK